MVGIFVVMKKEISDTITSRTFQITFGVLFVIMMMIGIDAGLFFKNYIIRTKEQLIIIQILGPTIKWMGAFVALTLGFNTIKKESSEGSLKILLSYPIYRDQIILGKFFGNLIVLLLAISTSMSASFAVNVIYAGFIPEPSTILNFLTFIILSVIFLSGYLGLSILLSITFKDVKTTLLVTFFILAIFNSETLYSYGLILSNIIYGVTPRNFDIYLAGAFNPQPGSLIQLLYSAPSINPQAQALQAFFAGLSPAYGYSLSSFSLMFTYRSILMNDVTTSVTWWDIIVNNLSSIVALVLLPIITFTGSYVLFMRRDVT